MSRGKVTPATVSYYADEVARGLEDYYAGRGEAKGYWIGAGSAHERLRGEVEPDALARLFDGSHPGMGESLGAPYRVADAVDRVTGWDLTFSAPKSVSTVWAIGGGETGMQVREAHDASVAAAIRFLEEHAAFSRTGKAGVRQVDTHGFLAAAFVHRSSRAGDPQLHTHVLVSGRVRCEDEVWRALDSRALHRQLKPAGMVYQAALRAELTARLGVAWTTVDRNGQAEIEGVPVGLRRLYSQRRAAVEGRAAELITEWETRFERDLTPEERSRAFERAVLDTRDAKGHRAETDQGLHDRWRNEADLAGHSPDRWLGEVLARSVEDEPARAVIIDEVIAELARTRSTWRRTDVVRELARRAPTSLGSAEAVREWIESCADAALTHPVVVALTAPALEPPVQLRRRDGASVFDRHGAVRFTTLATLDAEQHVIDLAERGRSARRGIADPSVVEDAIGRAGLGEDQGDAVLALTLGGDAIACVVGPAGTGKTRTMRAAHDAWTASGVPVRGLTLSAVAAGVLATEAGVPSDTVAKFLFEHDRATDLDGPWRLRPGEVVIVDEAAMVATHDLARLTHLADQARAKLVLVGDPAQLGAVEAGGLFAVLAASHAVELAGVRRFSNEWERHASLRLRARDRSAIDLYEAYGRLVDGDRLGVLDAAEARWHLARANGESIVVCATDNPTVRTISERIRAGRVAMGEVERGGVRAGEQIVGVGDEIVTTRNDRRITTTGGEWVRNGDRWAITDRHHDGGLDVGRLDGQGRGLLPADYVAEHVALGYALTVHKAQGVTVDRAVLVVDETTTVEALYVGMTRGRHDNVALVCCDSLDLEHREPPAAAREVLARALARTSADEAAIVSLRHALHASESLAVLGPRLANLEAQLLREIPDDPGPELQTLAARRARIEQHARPGTLTRKRRDDRRVLRSLDERQAELETARDRRDQWLDAHADLFVYRDELRAQASARRSALGITAAAERPGHLVELLGHLPVDDEDRRRWISAAARVEAYREEWSIEPEGLARAPFDGVQQEAWNVSVRSIEISNRLDALAQQSARERGLDRGLGVEL
ncbi:MAG: MobF family relaxase [Acidimicrobiia bacterium]